MSPSLFAVTASLSEFKELLDDTVSDIVFARRWELDLFVLMDPFNLRHSMSLLLYLTTVL